MVSVDISKRFLGPYCCCALMKREQSPIHGLCINRVLQFWNFCSKFKNISRGFLSKFKNGTEKKNEDLKSYVVKRKSHPVNWWINPQIQVKRRIITFSWSVISKRSKGLSIVLSAFIVKLKAQSIWCNFTFFSNI